LTRLERRDEAHEARQRVMELGPDRPFAAIALANSARIVGRELELALKYLDETVVQVTNEAFDPDGDLGMAGYAGWRKYNNRIAADLLHSRALVLLQLDRPDDAVRSLRRACALADRPDHHSALAALYAERGDEDAAFEHLARSVSRRLEREPDAFAEEGLPEELRTAWEARPYWHPGGLEGYMADRVKALVEE